MKERYLRLIEAVVEPGVRRRRPSRDPSRAPVGSVDDAGSVSERVTLKLLAYCRANDWAGYDPYDALNSRLFTALPFLNARLPRLCLTQALKRSPINIRPLALIPKTQNPKAMALFLSALAQDRADPATPVRTIWFA